MSAQRVRMSFFACLIALTSVVFAAPRPEALSIDWNDREGTPRAIFGRFQRPLVAIDDTAAARSFLSVNRALLGIDDATIDLEATRTISSPIGSHVSFRQLYRGVEVFGGEAAVHFGRDGDIIAVNNNYVPGIRLASVEPSIDLPDAIEAVSNVVPSLDLVTRRAQIMRRMDDEAEIRAALSDSTGNLVVYRNEGRDSLAWQIIATTERATWQVFVDAQSGAILGPLRDLNRYVTGTGQVYRVNAIVATHDNSLRDNNDAASAVPASAYMTVVLQGLAGNGFLDGELVSSDRTKKRVESPSNSFIFDRSSDGFSETMTYYYIDYAERYIQSLGFNNVNNRQQVFSVNRLKVDNSFYSPSTKDITLGIGGVDDAEDAEVSLHEYGHSIQDNQKPGFGNTLEAGSIGEGFGDYWGATVGAQFSGGFQDLCLAEWDATSYSPTNPPCLRRLDGTKHYPESVVGEVHADGEMWSAALWQIRTAIGAANADRVVIASHFLMTADTSFNQAANATVTAAINLGLKNNEVNAIRAILRNRGFTVTV